MAEKDYINTGIGRMLKVTVKDGVITRMRPLRLTEEDGGHWTIEARGKKFSDPRKTTINPFNIAENRPDRPQYRDIILSQCLHRLAYIPNVKPAALLYPGLPRPAFGFSDKLRHPINAMRLTGELSGKRYRHSALSAS